MKKIYLDRTIETPCAVFLKDAEVINAGTTLSVMPVKYKDVQYEKYAREYDIHFLFADNVPAVNFYAVPQLDIFATDGNGGFLGTAGGIADTGINEPVCFADQAGQCYLAAPNLKHLIEKPTGWKERLQPYDGVRFYASKADAEKELEFLNIEELTSKLSEWKN